MGRTIKAIEGHTTLPVRLGPQTKAVSVHSGASELGGKWQQRGPEPLSRQTLGKLRLAVVPTPSVIDRMLPLSEARRAHQLSQTGHAHGKIVLRVSNADGTLERKRS